MFRSIADDIRYQFQSGNTITRLIILNVGLFLLLQLFNLVLTLSFAFESQGALFNQVSSYLFLHDDLIWNATHPWTILTYMFTHVGFFHLLFNMLILYWFGRIAGDLLGDHRMLALYLYSGLTGALFYLIMAPLMYEGGSTLHGASGAVMGIVMAAGATAPDYQMRLLLIGDVRLKYIVATLIVLYLIGIANMDNAGGHMAHLGGAAFGFFYVRLLREGRDLTLGFQRLVRFIQRRPQPRSRPVKRKVPLEVRYRAGQQVERREPEAAGMMDEQERLDAILDKIRRSGIDSLDADEKKFLDEASQK